MKKSTLVLSAVDVEQIVIAVGLNEIMDQLIENMTTAFKSYNRKKTVIPIRAGFNYDTPERGLIEWMPIHQKGENVVVKLVGYHPDNPNKYNLPTIVSTISDYDVRTGHLRGLVDGVFLTALRTGAASAVASQAMAHPDSTTLGLIGCGAQAITQLHALSRIFDLKKVLYFDNDEATSLLFAERAAVLNLPVAFQKTTIETIVRQSDIICTATSIDVGKGPLFQAIPTQVHLHINAVGSDFPGKIELPITLLQKSFVCPDFIEQALIEGECQQLKKEDINVDLFQCLQYPNSFTYLKTQRTVFDSTGLSLEDSVVMTLFMKYAADLGIGTEMEIENMFLDTKNPYGFLKKNKQPQESVIASSQKSY